MKSYITTFNLNIHCNDVFRVYCRRTMTMTRCQKSPGRTSRKRWSLHAARWLTTTFESMRCLPRRCSRVAALAQISGALILGFSFLWGTHLRAVEHHLLYGIAQYYLSLGRWSPVRQAGSDCNPVIEFSVLWSGIEKFVIPGFRFGIRLTEWWPFWYP